MRLCNLKQEFIILLLHKGNSEGSKLPPAMSKACCVAGAEGVCAMLTRLLSEQIRSPLWDREKKKRYPVQQVEFTTVEKCSTV